VSGDTGKNPCKVTRRRIILKYSEEMVLKELTIWINSTETPTIVDAWRTATIQEHAHWVALCSYYFGKDVTERLIKLYETRRETGIPAG
jgi:hypothetical protein